MKKRRSLIICFLFTAAFAYSDQQITSEKGIQSIIKSEYFSAPFTTINPRASQNYHTVIFFLPTGVQINTMGKTGQPNPTIFGKYQIQGSSIILKTNDARWDTSGQLYKTGKPIKESYYIQFSDGTILWKQHKLQKGESFSFQDIPLIAVCEEMITHDNVRIRTGPATKNPYLTWKHFGDEYPYLPNGTICSVIARTLDKVQIGDWNHYWYLVETRNVYLHSTPYDYLQVWAFGEFFEPVPAQYYGDEEY